MVKKKTEDKTEDSSQESEEQEGQKDQDFVSFALRQPKTGPYEHIISEYVAQAVITKEPLKKTKVICEASFFVPDPKREELAIDSEKTKILDDVANALLTASKQTNRNMGIDFINVPWPFYCNEENFNKYIAPWFNGHVHYWLALLPSDSKHVELWRLWGCPHCHIELCRKKMPCDDELEYFQVCKQCNRKYHPRQLIEEYRREPIEEPLWSFFFEVTKFLTQQGYDAIKNNFVSWANPQVQQILFNLTGAVDPSLYSQILGVYDKSARKDYAKKVNEKADEITGKEGANGE